MELLEWQPARRSSTFAGGALPTDAGRPLLPYAEAMLAAAKDRDCGGAQRGNAGPISLALVGTLANASLTRLLGAFNKRYPAVRLDLRPV